MKHKKAVVVMIILILLVLIIGLLIAHFKKENIEPKEDERPTKFTISYSYASSFGTIIDTWTRVITVDQDGNVSISLKTDKINVEPLKYTVDKNVALELFDYFSENKFLNLKEDLSDYDVLDGGSSYLEVKYKGVDKQVGGSNPRNKTYSKLTSRFREKIIDNDKVEEFEKMVEKEYEKSNN